MSIFDKEEFSSAKYMAEKIPYQEIVGENLDIVENKDGKIFAVYKLFGIDDRMREAELEMRCDNVAKFFSMGFNKNYEFTFDFVRLQKFANEGFDERLSPEFKNASEVRKKRKDYLSNLPIFENTVYFSVCFQPYKVGKNVMLTKDSLEEFENNLKSCESSFESFGFTYQRIRGNDLYTYLYSSLSGNFFIKGLKIPQEDLYKVFANEIDFTPSSYPLLIDNKRLLQTIAIRSLPYETTAFTLIPLLSVPYNIRAIFKINPYSFAESEDFIYKRREDFARSIFRGTALFKRILRGDQNGADEDEIDLASQMGKEGCDNALYHRKEANVSSCGMSISIFLPAFVENMDSEGLERAEKFIDDKFKHLIEVLQNLKSLGVKLEKETTANTLVFLSSFIGSEVKFRAGELHAILDTAGDLLPLSSMQEEYNSPFLREITGSPEALLMGTKLDGSLYSFSPFGNKEMGHTFISAPTRAGKSILLALMANEWLKYKNTRLVYIDIGLSCLKTIIDNNGSLYYPLGGNEKFKTYFQPFRNAGENIEDCLKFIEAIAVANNFEITPEERIVLADIFRQTSETFKGKETITSIRTQIDSRLSSNTALIQGLLQYEQQYSGLFNTDDDSFTTLGRVAGIELEEIMAESDVIKLPTLVYILNSIEKQLNYKNPTMIILDEAWRFLNNEYFQGFIRNWLKTLAKKRAFVVIATQELNDLIKSNIVSTILENTETRIYLTNENAEEEITREAYKKVGLSDDEINTVASMDKFWTYIKQDGKRTVCYFNRDVCMENLKSEDEFKDNFRKGIVE